MSDKQEPDSATRPVDSAALGLALGRAGATVDEEAVAFLRDQRRMLHMQMEEMREENPLKLSHLRIRRFGDYAKMALEISVGLLMLALVAGISLMVWNAAHAEGVVIESFTVPPDMAAKGLTGQVVASQLLDRLAVIQAGGPGGGAGVSQAISLNGADDVKVEIPDTGVSIGEVYRFLRKWLGHEVMVSGEVWRTADGVAIGVRVGGGNAASYTGPEAGLDELIQKAAEHIGEINRPYRYSTFLRTTGNTKDPARLAQAMAVLERVINDPSRPRRMRAQALNSLAINYATGKADERTGLTLARRAHETDPDYALGFANLATVEQRHGHGEAALALAPAGLQVLERDASNYNKDAVIDMRARLSRPNAVLRGDFAEGVRQAQTAAEEIGAGPRRDAWLRFRGISLAGQHDGAARAVIAQLPPPAADIANPGLMTASFEVEAALENWPSVIVSEAAAEAKMTKELERYDLKMLFSEQLHPWLALARARTGDVVEAQAVIAATPLDCYHCVRIRGTIAQAAGQTARADYWFARAIHDGPSMPMAYADWGQALLARGKPDDAIEKFKQAHQMGPHFADALLGWGEALMAKNQSHMALAKFKEAEKYAPNWGRLHLKWGEALAYAGKPVEARAQFARATALDLTQSEKAELARHP